MEELNRDLFEEEFLRLNYQDALSLCSTNRRFSNWCRDDQLWRAKIRKDFPYHRQETRWLYQSLQEAKKAIIQEAQTYGLSSLGLGGNPNTTRDTMAFFKNDQPSIEWRPGFGFEPNVLIFSKAWASAQGFEIAKRQAFYVVTREHGQAPIEEVMLQGVQPLTKNQAIEMKNTLLGDPNYTIFHYNYTYPLSSHLIQLALDLGVMTHL